MSVFLRKHCPACFELSLSCRLSIRFEILMSLFITQMLGFPNILSISMSLYKVAQGDYFTVNLHFSPNYTGGDEEVGMERLGA